MRNVSLCCVVGLAACVGPIGDPVALRYRQATPIVGAGTPDQRLATVGSFEYWGGCNIDVNHTVTVSLWVIPATGTFSAIGHVATHGDDDQGLIPIGFFNAQAGHYIHDVIGPVVIHNPIETQVITYSQTADATAQTCSISGTVLPTT